LRAGTPTYSAPEHFRDNRADPVADVFSLGVLLYECLVGRPPWRVDSWAEMVAAQMVTTAPDVPGLPAEVAAIVGRCLQTDPAKRPSSAQVALVLAAAAGRTPRGQAAVPTAQPTVSALPRPTMFETDPAGAGLLPAERPIRNDRLGLVGIVGVVAALVVVAMLISTSLSGGEPAVTGGTALPNAATASQSDAPAPSASPTAANTNPANTYPANPAASLAAVQGSVEAGVAAGDIAADSGNELLADVQQLRKRLEQGKPAKVAEVAGDLLKKIGEWARDGRITPQRAAELHTLLQPLAAG
jgi:serine/threonine-protein kinase